MTFACECPGQGDLAARDAGGDPLPGQPRRRPQRPDLARRTPAVDLAQDGHPDGRDPLLDPAAPRRELQRVRHPGQRARAIAAASWSNAASTPARAAPNASPTRGVARGCAVIDMIQLYSNRCSNAIGVQQLSGTNSRSRHRCHAR